MATRYTYILNFLVLMSFVITSACIDNTRYIIPETGYEWPDQNRNYWPTIAWEFADLRDHQIDPKQMAKADQFAEDDDLSRALLVVKGGYLVFEKYYHGGGVIQSTNLHSVTKSFSSALVGFLMDGKVIESADQRLFELMPAYPEFDGITIHHALTHTTGLSWSEEGIQWENWVGSDDWVAEALSRGFVAKPGEKFKYSSANSQFLTTLVYEKTGIYPGHLAKDRLFDHLGIDFDVYDKEVEYKRWKDYVAPLSQSWRKDTRGVEIAGTCLYLTARDMAKFGFLYLNRGRWEDEQILSKAWIETSTKEHVHNIHGRYSYGYHWWITNVGGHPAFLASGYDGQIIGVVPSLDMVVVLKYDAENPVHPKSGTSHDDMYLFELVLQSVDE